MQQKLLRKAGLLTLLIAMLGFALGGCIDEPDPQVVDKVFGSVRIIHGVSDVPAVDIYIDDVKIAANVSYQTVIPYFDVKAGNRSILVVTAGNAVDTLFHQLTSIRTFTQMTIVFYGLKSSEIKMLLTQERFTYADETAKMADSADVKLINLNERSEAIVIRDGSVGGTVLMGPIDAFKISAYKRFVEGKRKWVIATSPQASEIATIEPDVMRLNRYSYVLIGTGSEPHLLTLTDPAKP